MLLRVSNLNKAEDNEELGYEWNRGQKREKKDSRPTRQVDLFKAAPAHPLSWPVSFLNLKPLPVVSLCLHFRSPTDHVCPPPLNTLIMASDEDEFVVERIIKKRIKRGHLEYLIKWQGYSEDDNTWEPVTNLNCDELIAEFETRYNQEKPQETPRSAAKVKTPARQAAIKSEVKVEPEEPKTTAKSKSKSLIGDLRDASAQPPRSSMPAPASAPISSQPSASRSSLPASNKRASQPTATATKARGFDRGLEYEKIIGATDIGGQLQFLIKWKGCSDTELVPAKEANAKIPQAVISFYEERLTWAPNQLDRAHSQH